MQDRMLGAIRKAIDRNPMDAAAYYDMVSTFADRIRSGQTEYHAQNKEFREEIVRATRRASEEERYGAADKLNDAYWFSMLLDAPVDFDSYCLYIEKSRDVKKQFYLPRRNKLLPVVREIQRLMDDELDILGVSLPPGVGKLLADDTPVMTADGWKRHGDLHVGDRVVGMDGKYKRVLHVFEKNVANYEIEFTNGERIRCHENHEWVVYDRHCQKVVTRTVRQMLKGGLESGTPGKRGHRYHYQLPIREPMEGTEKELPVPPYLLGAWLGDGTATKPAVTLCNTDTVILAEFMRKYKLTKIYDQAGCKRYEFDWLREKLQMLGMCRSHQYIEKYIPEMYLTASVEQRLELLAGLIDTDGTKDREGRYTFCTTGEKLRQGMKELISTFGWRWSETECEPAMSSSGVLGKKTVYSIQFCPDIYIPCRVPRKRMSESAVRRKIAVKAIRPIEPVSGNCIQVEDGIYLAGKTMLPTHNSTLAIFLLTWVAGRWPEEPNLTGSHNNAFVRGAYDECLRIFDPNGEYLWHDVFPTIGVTNTNAKDLRIDLGNRKRFETLEFTSIGAGNAGLYRAMRLLFCDDLVAGLEVALSKERLDKLWDTYAVDLRQRKIGDHCKELHIATRWSVHDVLGRLEEQYEGNNRAKFIVVPALDENDESNFDYKYGVGFSTAFYREQREVMDDVSWKCLYMNQPVEREGLLYTADELQRYFELPDGKPDAILCICDTKDRGKDFCSMPILYQYGDRYFVDDVVYDNSNPELVEPRLVEKCIKHKVQMGQFESNSAGGRVALWVQDEIRKRGGITKLTTKFTSENKETKIIANSPFVKEHFIFKDDSVSDKEYKKFMNAVCSYSMDSRNKHDDACDVLAMSAEYVQMFSYRKVEVFARPF